MESELEQLREQVRALSAAAARPSVSSANIVLPLAAALSLAAAGVAYGFGSGRTETTLQSLVRTVEGVRADITPLTTETIKMQGRLNSIEERLAAQGTSLRLLQDYTEGRIGRMPYRGK